MIEDNDDAPLAAVFGVSGETLTKEEKAFFKDVNPLGFILFTRNCADPKKTGKLVDDLKKCTGRDAPVLIDQEGGRVQRLKPPHWGEHPPARKFGELFVRDFSQGRAALQQATAAIAAELKALGINVNCAPVMDVQFPQTHDAIGDRAFSKDPEMVAALGAAVCEEYLKAGVVPVIKHIPGHGRAAVDSHKELPRVHATAEEMQQTDFLPFRRILSKVFSEGVWGMVPHVVYTAIDPRAPASCSRRIIWDVIRKDIGFKGFLLSDDICMGALEEVAADMGARAEKVLRSGCDAVLHCNGDFAEMQKVAKRAQKMTSEAIMRYNRSVSWLAENAA